MTHELFSKLLDASSFWSTWHQRATMGRLQRMRNRLRTPAPNGRPSNRFDDDCELGLNQLEEFDGTLTESFLAEHAQTMENRRVALRYWCRTTDFAEASDGIESAESDEMVVSEAFVRLHVRESALTKFFESNLHLDNFNDDLEECLPMTASDSKNSGGMGVPDNIEGLDAKSILALLDTLRATMEWKTLQHDHNVWYAPSAEDDDCDIAQPAPAWMIKVAEDPCTPPLILEKLALSRHSEIKMAVADNPSTPLEFLWLLVNDKNPDVRYGLAENHNIERHIIEALADDDNPYVASRARATLQRLSKCQIHSVNFNRGNSKSDIVIAH